MSCRLGGGFSLFTLHVQNPLLWPGLTVRYIPLMFGGRSKAHNYYCRLNLLSWSRKCILGLWRWCIPETQMLSKQTLKSTAVPTVLRAFSSSLFWRHRTFRTCHLHADSFLALSGCLWSIDRRRQGQWARVSLVSRMIGMRLLSVIVVLQDLVRWLHHCMVSELLGVQQGSCDVSTNISKNFMTSDVRATGLSSYTPVMEGFFWTHWFDSVFIVKKISLKGVLTTFLYLFGKTHLLFSSVFRQLFEADNHSRLTSTMLIQSVSINDMNTTLKCVILPTHI